MAQEFKPDADDAEAIRAAIELQASQAEEARPRPQFVSDLRGQLEGDLSDDPAPEISPRAGGCRDAVSSKASASQRRP